MNAFWGIIANNAIGASAMAVGVLLLGRIWKNAAAVHLLWILVLLKLFTPPVITAELPRAFAPSPLGAGLSKKALSRPVPGESRSPAPVFAMPSRDVVAEGILRHAHQEGMERTAGRDAWSLSTTLVFLWAFGSGCVALAYAVGIRRFLHALRGSEAATPAIRSMVAELSGRLGLRREPEVLMTSRALPPLVWSFGTAPRVILPAALFDRLTLEAQRTILAHELAHIRRGDYLVRLLELLATTVFWWHPVVWLAGRQIRELEEQCCDGRVLELLPDRSRTYAAALVDTLEYLAWGTCPAVPLRTAIHSTTSLTRRLHMLTQPRTNRLTAQSLALIAGFAGLPLAVTFAQVPEPAVKAAPEAQKPPGNPAAILQGRVTSKAGAPLPGARVIVSIPAIDMRFIDADKNHLLLEAKSDANGDYRLELPGIARRTTISIDASLPGFRRLAGTVMGGGDARKVDVEPGGAVQANLPLETARYYGGIVVDEQGRPVQGVEVAATLVFPRGMAWVEVTMSGADGSFEVFNYFSEPVDLGDGATKGVIVFSHPDYIESKVEDVYAIKPDRRGDLRVVLPSGHKVTGLVVDVAGKPVANAMVEADLVAGSHRKATKSDADGRFTLRGLSGGPTMLKAQAMDIKQNTRLSLALDGDKIGYEVRLQPIVWPANLKKHAVLGMELTDVTPEMKSAYDLWNDRGALILDPGHDFARLDIGQLAEGYSFWMVGDTRVGGVREFVDQLLAETGGRVAEEYSIRVVYTYKTTDFTGTNTQHMKLTKDDIRQLQAVSDQLKADAK